jgi:hypothetical protein
MGLTAILTKTEKGLDEISTRQSRLSARIRAMLIMVDGKRTGNELIAQSVFGAEAEQYLTTLIEAGFIAAQSVTPDEQSIPAQPAEDISLAKRFVIQTLHEFLGPDADTFAERIEKAKTAQELLQHLEKLREVLLAAAGKKKTDDFFEKISLVLA